MDTSHNAGSKLSPRQLIRNADVQRQYITAHDKFGRGYVVYLKSRGLGELVEAFEEKHRAAKDKVLRRWRIRR